MSQFTLYNRLKGNKPDFHLAMQGPAASNLYNSLLKKLGEQYSDEKIKGTVDLVVPVFPVVNRTYRFLQMVYLVL